MKSKRYILNILFRILILIVFSSAAGWSFTSGNPKWISTLLCVGLFVSISEVFVYVTRVNRQVNYFFEAVKNEDFTLRLPPSPGDRVLQELYLNMEEVNNLFRRTHVETRQMEQYFQSMIEHAGTGIFSFDQKGFVLHANSAFRKMIGRDIFTHIRQLEQVDEGFYKTVTDIKPAEQRLVSFYNERGIIQLSIKAVSFRNQQNDIMLLALQDIHKVLDEKELDSWLKLIRVLMHEIMNSIAPITSLADSLSGYFKIDGKPKIPGQINEKDIQTAIKGLEIIREQGMGLTSFVESYRKLTRLPNPVIKKVNVMEMINDCIMLARSMENSTHIEFIHSSNSQDLILPGDEQLLKQVLVNLLRNSVQALENRKNAKIEIKAKLNTVSKPEICVKDNGHGIDPKIIDQIFVPFFTTHTNGSGIGLSISRQIMRMHGGSLTVRSVPGKETIFCMVF